MDLTGYSFETASIANAGNEELSSYTPATGTACEKGVILKVKLTVVSGPTSGDVTVGIYNDHTYGDLVYENVFDLSGALKDYIACGFISDGYGSHPGVMYIKVTNNSGTAGVFQVDVTCGAIVPAEIPVVGDGTGVDASVAGPGITYDAGEGVLALDIYGTTPGLELIGSGNAGQLRVDSSVLRSTDATVVKTTGDQDLAGKKRFSSHMLGLVPAGVAGAPTAGTHEEGDIWMDDDHELYLCTADGTPGTWRFIGSGLVDGLTTAAVADASAHSVDVGASSWAIVTITTLCNFGTLAKLNVWGRDQGETTTEQDLPIRVICFPTEDHYRRDQLWDVSGQIRKTQVASRTSATELVCDSVAHFSPGDLVRLRDCSADEEEYARITSRSTTNVSYTFFENVSFTATNDDLAMYVNEFVNLPWLNRSVNEPLRIHLGFFNDSATAVTIGYEYLIQYHGGGGA